MWRGTCVAAVLVAAAVLEGWAPVSRADELPARRITYQDDRLSVRLTQAPVTEVLDEVARQAGAEIRGSVREERQVSAEFSDLPLPEGLARLLGAQNFTLLYGPTGLKAIDLLGGPQAAARTPAAALPTSTTTPAPPGNLMQMLAARPPLPVSGRLAQVLGGTHATFAQLVDAAMHQEDAVVRTDALRAWLSGVESDAELRQAFVGQVGAADDNTLVNLVRGTAGVHAEEFMLHLATQARTTEIKSRAATLLQQLRRTPPAPG